MASDLQTRFFAKILPEPMSGCWLWTGWVDRNGYGEIALPKGSEKRRIFAHRLSYQLHCGDPAGMHVCHHCDVPSCVNPAHLFLGTQADNMRDKERKGRGVKPRGEHSGRARLTEQQVREILAAQNAGEASASRIARSLGVSRGTIRQILEGNNWRHLPRG